jgi:hypothetical protein
MPACRTSTPGQLLAKPSQGIAECSSSHSALVHADHKVECQLSRGVRALEASVHSSPCAPVLVLVEVVEPPLVHSAASRQTQACKYSKVFLLT